MEQKPLHKMHGTNSNTGTQFTSENYGYPLREGARKPFRLRDWQLLPQSRTRRGDRRLFLAGVGSSRHLDLKFCTCRTSGLPDHGSQHVATAAVIQKGPLEKIKRTTALGGGSKGASTSWHLGTDWQFQNLFRTRASRPEVCCGSGAAVAGRLMAQPVYLQLRFDRTARSCPEFAPGLNRSRGRAPPPRARGGER